MNRFYRLLLFILICFPISCCFIVRPKRVPEEPKVAVAVLWDVDTIFITSKSPYTIINEGRASNISGNTTLTIISAKDSIIVLKPSKQKLVNSSDDIIFESPDDISIGTNSKSMSPYRRRVVIKRDVTHRFPVKKILTAINILPIEKYLYGVVSCEIGMAKEHELEAVKAQAVCARSYTMSLLGKRKDFDLYGSYLYDQEYKGLLREYEVAIKAVDQTHGEIMQFNKEPILAQYHACCGGTTADGRYPYLKSIIDSPHYSHHAKPYCKDSPHFEWNIKFSRKTFRDTILKLAGIKYKFDITPKLDINKTSKRVKHLKFTADKEYKLTGDAIRKALNLKSTFFTLKTTKDSVEFQGHGWGHGIGLCQYGALEMARQKISYKNILKHYYTGVKIVKLY